MPRARPPGHGLGGRPRRERLPDDLVTLTLRLTSAQREAVTVAAREAGLSISGWLVAQAEKRETPEP